VNAPPLPRASAALSAAQHKAALWTDAALHVYAVVMGSRVVDLPARLTQAQDGKPGLDVHCLRAGALSPAEQAAAAYLVRLHPDAAFTNWLLDEAAAGHPDWGVLVRSKLETIAMRSHARALCQARTPSGEAIQLAWMDPAVLRLLLPLAAPDQLRQIFEPVAALSLLEPARWTHFRLALGRLQTELVDVTVARA
jgi:hypothetical protein